MHRQVKCLPAAPATRVVSSRDYKQQWLQQCSIICVDRFYITPKLIPAALLVVTVDRRVHAALCICHQIFGGRQTGRQTCRGKLMMSDQTGMRLGGECQDVEWCVQSKIEDVRTEFISFCSHGCSNVRRDLSNVGEGWEDRSRDKVLLCGLIS
jgi:hypothetical protein